MIERSKNFWLAAFFLSKYSDLSDGKGIPPHEFDTEKWDHAYQMFYESLSEGRSISTFKHSLKNARDSYDSHFKEANRAGWKDSKGKPQPLNRIAKSVFEEYSKITRDTIWSFLKTVVDKEVITYGNAIKDLEAIQQSETSTAVIAKTEGGKKVIISHRYERNPSLRNQAFKIHGYKCIVCGFNFIEKYGVWGKDFAEVHHVEPLSLNNIPRKTNPVTDLVVVCANCHRMIHRKKGIVLSVEELKSRLL